MTPGIYPVIDPNEEKEAAMRMTEIRFDCLVKMYDYGFRSIKLGLFGENTKPMPPQRFCVTNKLTLEFIKHESPHVIGSRIKEMLQLLEAHIKQYEDKR